MTDPSFCFAASSTTLLVFRNKWACPVYQLQVSSPRGISAVVRTHLLPYWIILNVMDGLEVGHRGKFTWLPSSS